jgi:hypothetical protein
MNRDEEFLFASGRAVVLAIVTDGSPLEAQMIVLAGLRLRSELVCSSGVRSNRPGGA